MADPLGAVVLRAGARLRRTHTFRMLDGIRTEPFVPRELAMQRQLERLQSLVRHCDAHVPYYQRVFREAGFTPHDLRSLDDFARLPVLTKADVAAHAEEMIAQTADRSALMAHHSGGSTGVPLTFYRDLDYAAASEAGTYRNFMQCGWTPGEMIGFFWGWNDRIAAMPKAEFVARQFVRRMYQFDPFQSGPEDMERWWREWRWVRPRVAHGYASTIARFARFLKETGRSPRPLRGVFTTAEKLFPEQRELISEVFGCTVYDCYGSSEVQNIATQCRRGSMHINADFVMVEMDDRTAASGAAPLLVTSLKNYAMPFLRYRNEDQGALVDGTCDCNNGFPLMSLDVARVSDNFPLPNGRTVHGEFFTHLLYGSEGVDSFQFHQIAPDTIVLRYVRAGSGDPSRAVNSAVAQVKALAPDMLDVRVEEVSAIALSNAGKHRFTRSDVN